MKQYWLTLLIIVILSIIFNQPMLEPQNLELQLNDINSKSKAFELIQTRAASDNDWPMLYHDAGLSKFSGSSAPREKYILWTFNETEYGRHGWYEILTDPVVYEGKVFIGGTGDIMYALDEETGKELWNVSIPISHTVPAIADDIMVFGTYDYHVYAIDTNDGDILWKYNTSSKSHSYPIINDGKVFISAGYNHILKEYSGLYCFDLDPSDHIDEGENDPVIAQYDLIWYQQLDKLPGVVAVWSNNVYAIIDNNLWIFDADDGSILWIHDEEDEYYYNLPAIINDKLFLQGEIKTDGANTEKEFLGCYDPVTIEPIWVFKTEDDSHSIPLTVAGSGNEVYFLNGDTIYALPLDDSNNDGTIDETELIWTYQMKGYGKTIGITQNEIVVTDESNLYCIDRPSGELIWDCRIYKHSFYSYPAIACDKFFISDGQPGENWAQFTVFSSYPSDFPNASLKVEGNEYYTLTNIKFDASNSTDDVGELKFRFNFGDGYNTTWVDDPIIHYEYQKFGNYTIDVIVKDIHGFKNRSKVKVNIKNRIPILPTFEDKTIKEIEYVKIKNLGDQIYDLDGEVVYFELDFGEGKPWKIESYNGINLSRINYFDHEYHEPGKFTVTITIKDDDGGINTTSFRVTVEEKLFYEHVFPEYRWIYFGLCPAIFIIVIILIVLLLKRRRKNKLS